MRHFHALLHAMRTRRTGRIDLERADRLVAGDPPGPAQAGLGPLLDALRAPGIPGELSGEKATVAAFKAHRKRAARAARVKSPARAVLVPALTALALLLFGGTALAARTGNLPEAAQQHAHRLFSALGVPAPRTGPPHPSPSPSPAGSVSPLPVELAWCNDWKTGGPPLSAENHRKLRAAAGSEQRIPGYCDNLRRSAAPPESPSPSPSTPSPSPTTEGPSSTPPPTTPSDEPSAHPSPS
jgi:hypothetical protein